MAFVAAVAVVMMVAAVMVAVVVIVMMVVMERSNGCNRDIGGSGYGVMRRQFWLLCLQ